MVQTRSTSTGDDTFAADPLTTIAARPSALDVLTEKVNALEANASLQYRSHSDRTRHTFRRHYVKLDFAKFSGGDPRGWILKVEKNFRYYETTDADKVEVASIYLEGDALDLYSWDKLVKILQEYYGPSEYQNPDEHLCNIKQTGTVHEYRQEWARWVTRVSDWPDYCLLGVFLNGLKEELKVDIRIQKPRSVFHVTSLVLEYEGKAATIHGNKSGPSYKHTRSGSSSFSQHYTNRGDKGGTAPIYGISRTTPVIASSSASSTTFSNSTKNSTTDLEQ